MNLNKAIICGRLAADPQLKALPNGVQVASFTLVTNHSWKDKDGETRAKAEYHHILVFGKMAGAVDGWLKKGQVALVVGRLQTRSWESDGRMNYKTEIVADQVQFGQKAGTAPNEQNAPSDERKEKNRENTDEASEQAGNKKAGGKSARVNKPVEYPDEEIDVNDIPF